jgi:16S rRNA (guanine1207-N2)-methyltransferase
MGDGTRQYFAPTTTVASKPATVELALPDLQLQLTTDRATFSAGAVDPGTKLLLLDGPRPDPATTGHLLDLGCGYGPIACTLARRAPEATVWAIDVNQRALGLCAQNARTAKATGVHAVEPDAVPGDIAFAGIWSNPPIRIGKAALHDLLLRWLPRLAPGAKAWLVVHKHLGSDSLARWLTDEVGPTTRLGSRSGYRILEVAPPT